MVCLFVVGVVVGAACPCILFVVWCLSRVVCCLLLVGRCWCGWLICVVCCWLFFHSCCVLFGVWLVLCWLLVILFMVFAVACYLLFAACCSLCCWFVVGADVRCCCRWRALLFVV